MKNYFRVFAAVCGASALALGAEEAIVNRNKVNVRGGPNLTSEVVAQLQKGDHVTVVEDVPAEKPKAGEPAKWTAIKLPASAHVWVFTDFLDKNHTVKVPRLNLRGGPGENFSVLGRLEKGATVKEIRVVDNWMEIEAPESTRAYVDANYLERPAAETKETVAAQPPLTEEKLNVFEPPKATAAAPKTEPVPPVAKSEPAPVVPPPAKSEPIKLAAQTEPAPAPAETKKVVETKPEPKSEPTPIESKPAEAARPAETKIVESKPVETKPAEVKPEEPKPLETTTIKEEPKPIAAAPKEEKQEKPAENPSTAAAPAKPEENAAKPVSAPVAEKAAPADSSSAAAAPKSGAVTPLPKPAELPPEQPRVLPQVANPLPGRAIVVNQKRVVRREGDVRSTKFNIQAPTYFELVGEHGKLVNFLSGEKAGIKVKDYKGLHVIVTGEESIDPRFKETPLLEIETIEVAP